MSIDDVVELCGKDIDNVTDEDWNTIWEKADELVNNESSNQN